MRRSPEIRNSLALSAIMLMMRTMLAGVTPVYAETNLNPGTPDQNRHKIVIDTGNIWSQAGNTDFAMADLSEAPTANSPVATSSAELPATPDAGGPARQERDPLEDVTLVPIETHYFYAEGQYVTIQLQLGMHEHLQADQPLTHVAQWGVPSSKWHFGSNGTFLEVTITNDDGAEETFSSTAAGGNAGIAETLSFSDTPENPQPASVMAITDGTRVTGVSSEVNGQPLEVTGHVFWGEDAATGAEWVALQNMSGHWEMPFNQPGYTLEVGIGTLVAEEGQEPRLQLPTQWSAAVNGVVPIEVPEPQGYMVFRITPVAATPLQTPLQ